MFADKLKNFPVIRTSNAERFREGLITGFGAESLTLENPSGLVARGNLIKLSELSLGFSACAAPASVSFAESEYVRLQIGLAGRARTTVNNEDVYIDQDRLCITSERQSAVLTYGENYEQLLVRFDAEVLRRKLQALIGMSVDREILFDPKKVEAGQAAFLQKFVGAFAEMLDDNPGQLSPLVIGQCQQTLIVGILSVAHHNYSSWLRRDPMRVSLRDIARVEAFIEANADQPIDVERLAAIAGVSVRSLQRSFKLERGYSPGQFLKKIRLNKARSLLTNPTSDTTVTAVALKCGFASLGHFARDYQKEFGELPSQTLVR